MKNCCKTCGFFGASEHLRSELKQELENAQLDGACLEMSNGYFFLPLIHKAQNTHCGKWTKPIGELPQATVTSGKQEAFRIGA